MFIMIFSVILDVLFTLGPFSCWKWNRNFVWEQQPEVYLQRVNKEWLRTSVRLWLIMIDTKIFWFQMISTISWLIKCMLSIWRFNLFIKTHVSLKVNIYYSHMRKLILEPCAWICKHPWPWSWWLKIFISKWSALLILFTFIKQSGKLALIQLPVV
jgi:hypothetical protein